VRNVTAALLLGLFACTPGASAPVHEPTPPAPDPPPPAPPPTIAHRVLAMEADLLPGAEDVTATLDAFIDGAMARIQAATPEGTEREQAIATLSSISAELDARHFVYPGRGLVDTLHEGLADLLMNSAGLQSLASHPDNEVNEARQQLFRDAVHAPSTVFHAVDCDTFSILYLAVGDRLGLPITMVGLPPWGEYGEHFYVVWTLSDGTSVAWEATQGAERTDLDEHHYAPDGVHSRESHVARRASGVPMTDDEIMGYWHRIVGGTLRNQSLTRLAIAPFRESIRLLPGSPVAPFWLAWTLASSPDPQVRDPAGAIAVAEQLAADWPDEVNLDVLAAAYASAGRWEDARTTQCRVLAMVHGKPYDGTCDAITIDPDDPDLGPWEQPLAMYLRCQAPVEPRPTEWQAVVWRATLGSWRWDDLTIVVEPVPHVPPHDACGTSGAEPPR
jgi:hypothetical protein